MRYPWAALLTAVLVVSMAFVAFADDPPVLAETQRLKAQLQQAQEQLLQAQYQLATCNAQVQLAKLNESRAALEKELQAPPGYVFDWTTLTFKPVESKP